MKEHRKINYLYTFTLLFINYLCHVYVKMYLIQVLMLMACNIFCITISTRNIPISQKYSRYHSWVKRSFTFDAWSYFIPVSLHKTIDCPCDQHKRSAKHAGVFQSLKSWFDFDSEYIAIKCAKCLSHFMTRNILVYQFRLKLNQQCETSHFEQTSTLTITFSFGCFKGCI